MEVPGNEDVDFVKPSDSMKSISGKAPVLGQALGLYEVQVSITKDLRSFLPKQRT